jgi:alpha-mannosidase
VLLDKKILGKIGLIEKTYAALRFEDIATLQMEIAETAEHYHGIPDYKAGLTWRPVVAGDPWGDNWKSAWFRGSIELPEGIVGPAYVRPRTGAPESQLIIDGVYYGVVDVNHPVRLLSLTTEAGRTYTVHIEAYAGHGFPGTQPYDEPIPVVGEVHQDSGKLISKNCRFYAGVELATQREDVSRFVFALRALRQLAASLEDNSLRKGRIQAAFKTVFTLVYAKPAEVSETEWLSKLKLANTVMRPFLDNKNGPTSPFFGIIGHSHIDTAWLWTIAETKRKLARTFSSVLSLMDEYPEFRFTQSAAYHSAVIKELHPEIFDRMAERVREGRWEINGAMWIEPDCNIPSGESLVRQCLVGQTVTRQMFGKTSDTLWQPDVFGYSAALPQILQKSGVRYFCTTKLAWNDTNLFPYDTFLWRGIDGSSVVSHFNLIDCTPDPENLVRAWNQVQHKDVQDRRLMSFGYGDGGGGPTAEMIEMGRLTADLEGCPRVQYMSITEFMDSVRDELVDIPTWSGELYLELHRGTLTSVAPIKRFNRLCEIALRGAEFAATVALLLTGKQYPADVFLDLWKRLLLNQFHDILPGSSIAEVNDEAIASFKLILSETLALRERSLKVLSGGGDNSSSVMLANDLSWQRSGEMAIRGLPAGSAPVNAKLAQEIDDVDGQKSVLVDGIELPSLGCASFTVGLMSRLFDSPFSVAGNEIETPFARIMQNESGQIVSFYDKAARRELVTPGRAFNVLLLGEDVPASWDNWDTDRDQRLKLLEQADLVERTVVADGPLQLRIRQKYRVGVESELTQDIVFHAGTERVDFDTVVEWREKYQFLKVRFSPDIVADSARHEIQFGHLSRTTHDNTSYDRAQFDVCAHKWTDISETEYGVTFLNDCKYACTVKDGDYVLSLIKSGRHPDVRGDEGHHRFSYAFLPHQGGFSVKSVIRPAYEFNTPVLAVGGQLLNGGAFSLAAVDSTSVIIEAVKQAEDGNGFVLRLYESGKTGTHASIGFGIPITTVTETNLLEEIPTDIPVSNNAVALYFRPFEIKTLRCIPA